MDVAPGSKLGGYTIVRKLGSGGMGTVYLAQDETIGQQVAIKVLRADNDVHVDRVSEAHAAEQFRREARAVASLDHLHILPLYRYGEEEGSDGERRAYMVMQYRPEGSLWDWLRQRASAAGGVRVAAAAHMPGGLAEGWPIALEEMAEYVGQAASALQYAHERGIVHRDVKPANFLLRFDSQGSNQAFLLLSDFGLAKFYATTSATSTVFGTPTYMAPEQFEGEVGPESDQYALAIMTYYLLAGRPPFEGEPMRMMHQHLSIEPAPIRTFAPTVPVGVEKVLQRALDKKPAARYPSIMTFADAFKEQSYQARQAGAIFTLPTISADRTRAAEAAPTSHSHDPQDRLQQNAGPLSGGGPTRQEPTRQEQWGARDAAFASTVYEVGEREGGMAAHPFSEAGRTGTAKYPEGDGAAGDMAPTVVGDMVGADREAGMMNFAAGASASSPTRNMPSPTFLPSDEGPLKGGGPTRSEAAPSNAINREPLRLGATRTLQGGAEHGETKGEEGSVSRRSALWWILGGTAVVATGAGAGAYFYLNKKAPGGPISQPASGTPKPRPTVGSSRHFTLTGHSAEVTGVSWGPGGTKLASSSKDGTVRLWDITARQEVLSYPGHQQPVSTVAWSPTGQQLASGAVSLHVWNLQGQITHGPFKLGAEVSDLAWQTDEDHIFASTLGMGLQEIKLTTNSTAPIVSKGSHRALAISPDGRYLALGSGDGLLSVYTISDLRHPAFITHQANNPILALAWSYDSQSLAASSTDKLLRVWDITSNSIKKFSLNSMVLSLSWEPGSSNRLATALASGALIVWTLSADGGPPTHVSYMGHNSPCTAVAWGTKAIATGSLDSSIIIWNI